MAARTTGFRPGSRRSRNGTSPTCTLPEVGRALRALSSCYVERRSRLAEGAALEGAGQTRRLRAVLRPSPLPGDRPHRPPAGIRGSGIREIVDLGCGTGAAGAAWALARPGARIAGFDRSAWAVAEANWTYRQLGLSGRATRQDLTRVQLQPAARPRHPRRIRGQRAVGRRPRASFCRGCSTPATAAPRC